MAATPSVPFSLRAAGALAGLLALAGAPAPATAQHDDGGHDTPSPYTELLDRDIKALADDEAAALADGGGAGLALAAELNGWPGPLHVLELADRLGLDAHGRIRVEAVREAMLAEARPLGRDLVAAERELDRAFAAGRIEPDRVTELTLRAAELRGRLRAVHLRAHLATRAVLSDAQVEAYRVARGYGVAGG